MRILRIPVIVDYLVLLLLIAYVLVGMPIAPFHGDEPMQLYMSSDFFTAFVKEMPGQLMTEPPYPIDSDQHLRILNGSVNRYTIGALWNLAGYDITDLPPRPGWDWGLSYADNVESGRRPSEAQMFLARLPSALFYAGSILMMYGLGRSVGGRGVAMAAVLLYALHPALLLNGRRALQEGSMLFFGLASLWAAAETARKGGRDWTLLAFLCAMTLVSKHSGIVFVAGAFGWAALGYLLKGGASGWFRRLPGMVFNAVRSGILMLVIFVALSPALWSDPFARVGDLLAVRAELLDIQTVAAGGPMTLDERLDQIIFQPFIEPVMFYETAVFDVEPIAAEVAAYQASGLAGIPTTGIVGVILTVFAIVGVALSFVPRARPFRTSLDTLGLLIVLGAVVASLVANPLAWQRYYLPLMAVVTIYAGATIDAVLRVIVMRRVDNPYFYPEDYAPQL